MRLLLSALCWYAAAVLTGWAVRLRPVYVRSRGSESRAQEFGRFVVASIAELPREQILVDPALWTAGLMAHAAFPHEEEARA